jgi:glycosyltransferase involved in cell wall biosynthesis
MKQIRELCRSYCIDVIQGRSPSTFAYALAKKEKLPFAVSVHGTSFGEIDSYFKIPRKSIDLPGIRDAVITQPSWAFLTNLEYKHANKILAVSKAVAEEAIGYYRLPKEKVVVIHNGVQLIHAREEEREENLILSAGRMTWRKGFTYLIEAMPHILKEYPKAKLLLVGDGAYKRFLEEHTKRLQLEKSVSFCGNLPREKLLHLYAKAHAYVQPSLYEPLGNTVLEAMAAERPVIATRVGGIPEIITNEKDGLLIAPQSGLQIAEAVKTIFSDVSWSKKLGENAKARVEKSFSWELAAKKTLQLYESMCAIRAPNSENCS